MTSVFLFPFGTSGGRRSCTHLLATSVPLQRTVGDLGGPAETPGLVWAWPEEQGRFRDEGKAWLLFWKDVICRGQVPSTLGLTQSKQQFLCFAQKNPEHFPNLD